MSRQNRVNSFGELIATEARGALMGNRGILHDEHGNLKNRRWAHQNWVTCTLETKGTKRNLMAPGNYTELFFLDEATALASGHRPCWECRKENYLRFRAAWLSGNPDSGCDDSTSMSVIDRIIHSERVTPTRVKVTYTSLLASLPDGVIVSLAENPTEALLIWKGSTYPWQPGGYGEPVPVPLDRTVTVLTPYSIVSAIVAGYRPSVALKREFQEGV